MLWPNWNWKNFYHDGKFKCMYDWLYDKSKCAKKKLIPGTAITRKFYTIIRDKLRVVSCNYAHHYASIRATLRPSICTLLRVKTFNV